MLFFCGAIHFVDLVFHLKYISSITQIYVSTLTKFRLIFKFQSRITGFDQTVLIVTFAFLSHTLSAKTCAYISKLAHSKLFVKAHTHTHTHGTGRTAQCTAHVHPNFDHIKTISMEVVHSGKHVHKCFLTFKSICFVFDGNNCYSFKTIN